MKVSLLRFGTVPGVLPVACVFRAVSVLPGTGNSVKLRVCREGQARLVALPSEVNIFENGFLADFQRAQANLAASGGANGPNPSFAGSNLTIMNQAFGPGNGAFTNSTYLYYVSTGQAGALANAIASNSTYFCNLVGGANFSPCAGLGYTGSTGYPINIFQENPYATGEPTQLLSDPGSESYNGLQMQVKHTSRSFTIRANYVYSHAFTNRYIGGYYTSDEALANFHTLRNRRLSRAPSPYDLRNTFKVYALYTLPFKGSNPFLREAAAGWQLGTIVVRQTGRNFKIAGRNEHLQLLRRCGSA